MYVNAWSNFWGSNYCNSRGKIFGDIILASDLVVLNDGSPTHFSIHHTFTHVDITLCSSVLSPKCECAILDDLHGSDHYPIITKVFNCTNPSTSKHKPKFKTDAANWEKYKTIINNLSLKSVVSNNINKESATIQKILRSAAHQSIPQTNGKFIKSATPWWNTELSILRDTKQKAWHEFKRQRSMNYLLEYKKSNAKFRFAAKRAKNETLENFTASINPSSNPKKLWADIKALSGTYKYTFINILKTPQATINSHPGIANFQN